MLQYTGIAASTTLLAGCGSQEGENGSGDNNGGSSDSGNESGSDDGNDNAAGDDESQGEGENEDNGEEESEDNSDENESEGEGENESSEDSEWAGINEIVLDGYTEAWEGIEPEQIAGNDNPTVTLIEGQEYDFTWENADGQPHNIAIWDSNDEAVVEATETIDTQGETQTLTIEASQEMASYVCELHAGTMIGEIQIESSSSR